MKCLGPGPHTAVPFFDERGEYSLDMRALFQQELARNGILFLVGHNMSAAIEQTDLDQALEVYDGALAVMRDAVDSGDVSSYLKGSTVMPIFRKP
jgi:hypothetical protein